VPYKIQKLKTGAVPI